MVRHQRCELAIKPEYAYKHKDCQMAPPKGANINETLHFDIKLLEVYGNEDVRVMGPREDIYKTIMQRSDMWETPREPYTVRRTTCSVSALHTHLCFEHYSYQDTVLCVMMKWRCMHK